MGPTLTANVTNCRVNRGYVLPPNTVTATPNGITFGNLVIGSIMNNLIESNIATVLGASSTAVNVNNAGSNFTISGNTVTNNDNGIFAGQCGNNLVLQNNLINFTTTPGVNISEGIIVRDTIGLTILISNIMNVHNYNMELLTINGTNQPFQLNNNQFIGSQTGLLVTGSALAGPLVTMNADSFTGTLGYYIQETSAPNNIWPSTATVSFDGLLSGHITFAEFNQILTKIFDKHNIPTLVLVLDFIIPIPPILTSINPTFGPTFGGNTITITGSSFISSNTTVYFGANPGTNVTVVSDTTITVTVPPGSGTVDVTVVTPFGTTPIVPDDQYTYIQALPPAPLPPSNFIGMIKKNKFLNKTEYVLQAKWEASPSAGVILYRIYKNGHLADEVLAGSPLVFTTYVKSKNEAKKYQIVAVNSENLESTPVLVRIAHDYNSF